MNLCLIKNQIALKCAHQQDTKNVTLMYDFLNKPCVFHVFQLRFIVVADFLNAYDFLSK